MGKLKDVIFLRDVNSFKFLTENKSKEVHLEGGKGLVRAAFPQLPKQAGEKCSLSHQRPVWGEHLKQGLSLTGALSPRHPPNQF